MTRSHLFVFAVLLVGCSNDPAEELEQPLTLSFMATVAGSPLACGTRYEDLGTTGVIGTLADARLFVSGVQVRDLSGQWRSMRLDDASPWQTAGIALLDFEDGTEGCADSGTAEENHRLVGWVPISDYDRVRFDVGVPAAVNHADSAIAPAPLDVTDMFWTWQRGYKFLRVDWIVDGGDVPRWNVHLGAADCASNSPVEAPADACGRPNLAHIELDASNADVVRIDLAELMASVDMRTNAPDTPPGCMSAPTEAGDCGGVFSAIGLDFALGLCADDCLAQRVFSSLP